MNRPLIIIGCGVSGLTTGIVMREAGFDANIVTMDLPSDTVSSKAAAIWFPFQIGPIGKVNDWSKASYEMFEALAMDHNTGICMRAMTELVATEADAWWKEALPSHAIRQADPQELPQGFSMGYVLQVPVIETPIYLQWLMMRFIQLGGNVTLQNVQNITEFARQHQLVVNCTGLGAKELVGDNTLFPIRGQIVKVAPASDILCISADMQLWGSTSDLAYIIPRSDCIVLGGNVIAGNGDEMVDDAATVGIMDRCARLDPRIAALPILCVEVGLRPGRKEIRLEREANIIHNYGHGGSGYTVSWGTAMAVLELVDSWDNGHT